MSFFSRVVEASPAASSAERWVWIPPDQLRRDHPLIRDGDPARTALVFLESAWKASRRTYHKQKLVFVLSSQRHFALEMAERGHPVLYRFGEVDYGELLREVANERDHPGPIDVLEPSEPEVRRLVEGHDRFRIHENDAFITDRAFYDEVFAGKKGRRLETFYRAARRRFDFLMEGDEPADGRWNFDEENRERWDGQPPVPPRPWIEPDEITREVIDLVETRYGEHFGNAEPFGWPVTSEQAELWADHFFDQVLPHFGPFEDAMHRDERFLFHSLLSAPLNNGLLDPEALCRRAEKAWRDGTSPLPSVEGFIRQILGWREYMRHIYEELRPDWNAMNALGANEDLPDWYWTGESGLECFDLAVRSVLDRAHSHHITRLMVLSNLANLLGVDPQQLNEWFWFGYIDAWEWVVTPNVVGMATWADGGIVASKPYVSSARYIRKMGPTLCEACRYDPTEAVGEDACPFNYSYWDFVARNRDVLEGNHRMRMITKQLDRFGESKLAAMRTNAKAFRQRAQAGSTKPAKSDHSEE